MTAPIGGFAQCSALPDAYGAVTAATRCSLPPVGIREICAELSPRHAWIGETDFTPPEVDGYLGLYNASARTITLFRSDIEECAQRLRASASDLAFIVRLHEIGHAVHHLGLPSEAVHDLVISAGRPTIADGSRAIATRTRAFGDWSHETQEFIAQLVAMSAIQQLPRPDRDRLADAMLRLMRRQRAPYHLPTAVQLGVAPAALERLLDWVRTRKPPARRAASVEQLLAVMGLPPSVVATPGSVSRLAAIADGRRIGLPAALGPNVFFNNQLERCAG